MKLIVAVIQDRDAPRLLEALVKAGHQATKLSTTGGFLREGNTTLFVGATDEQVEGALHVIRTICHTREHVVPVITHAGAMDAYMPHPVEVTVGGAAVWVLPVEAFFRF